MHNPRPQRPADRREISEAIEQRADERARRFAGARMHRDARGLVDHSEIVIFVENIERNCFGGDARPLGLRNFDFHLLACLDAMRRLGEHAVDAHAPFRDQFLNPRAAQLPSARQQENDRAERQRLSSPTVNVKFSAVDSSPRHTKDLSGPASAVPKTPQIQRGFSR